MLIHLRSQATTTPGVRAAIQASDDAGTVLAERFGVTPQTVCKWRKRDSVEDRSQRAALQRPHRGCAAKPPLPIRRGPGDHPAPLCLALQPAAPSISLGQQGTLAGNEGLTQTQAADVQEKASYLPGCNKTNHPPHLDRRPRPHRRPPPDRLGQAHLQATKGSRRALLHRRQTTPRPPIGPVSWPQGRQMTSPPRRRRPEHQENRNGSLPKPPSAGVKRGHPPQIPVRQKQTRPK